MMHAILWYILLGILTLAVGELRGEKLLAANRAAAERAVPNNRSAILVGVVAGAVTAVVCWPAYALGMLLHSLDKSKGDP